jgi:hypothetical protein
MMRGVMNTSGDFSFVVMETVRFHMYTPRPILEYTPKYTEQETQVAFTFVRRDGNHRKLETFLTQ